MRLVSKVLVVFVLTGCSSDVNYSIVGTWTVTENVSEQVYQEEFLKDGTLRLTQARETNVGRYTVSNYGEHRELLITWSNGSQASIWVRFTGPNSMTFYDNRGEEAPDFTTAFVLGTLIRSHKPSGDSPH